MTTACSGTSSEGGITHKNSSRPEKSGRDVLFGWHCAGGAAPMCAPRARRPTGAQDSICLPRKAATVWASLCSTSPAGGEFFAVAIITQPMTSPSETTGAAMETQ